MLRLCGNWKSERLKGPWGHQNIQRWKINVIIDGQTDLSMTWPTICLMTENRTLQSARASGPLCCQAISWLDSILNCRKISDSFCCWPIVWMRLTTPHIWRDKSPECEIILSLVDRREFKVLIMKVLMKVLEVRKVLQLNLITSN